MLKVVEGRVENKGSFRNIEPRVIAAPPSILHVDPFFSVFRKFMEKHFQGVVSVFVIKTLSKRILLSHNILMAIRYVINIVLIFN